MIQLRSHEVFAFGVCCAVAGMQIAAFADRLTWISLAGSIVATAMAVTVILAARKRGNGPAAA